MKNLALSTTNNPDASDKTYDAASISLLSGLEAVRRNPGMYIGSTDINGLHHLVFELLDNAVDEARVGSCTEIDLQLHKDGFCSVEDNGRGIPVDLHPTEKIPACQVVLTKLHAGGKFTRQAAYRCSAGLHGVGLSCLNALSSQLTLDIWRDGRHFRQNYADGEPISPVETVGITTKQGTRISFRPDVKIFGTDKAFSYTELSRRLQELAFLHPGLRLSIQDNRENRRDDSFCYESGIAGFVRHLAEGEKPLHTDPIVLRFKEDGLEGEIGLQWTGGYDASINSFVNGVDTVYGGTHVDGLKTALTRTINACADELKLLKVEENEHIPTLDILEGLFCVISLQMDAPEFEGQTKTRVTNLDLAQRIDAAAGALLAETFRADSRLALRVTGRALDARRARLSARRVGERIRAHSGIPGFSREVYQKQFGLRSKNWHQSAVWIANDDLLAEHARHLQLDESTRLLDVCCGSGVVGAAFNGRVAHKTGLDITPEMISLARTRLDRVIQGNVYNLPFAEGSFDLVVNREVLHLLPAPEIPVSEIFRVLRPGGQFIVGQILPYGPDDAAWMYRVFKKKQPLICNMFQEEDFRELLLAAGFTDLNMSEFTLWESIDVWIDTHETTSLHRHEIRELFHHAPREVRDVHPFEILPTGEIRDLWRWCVFSVRKPA